MKNVRNLAFAAILISATLACSNDDDSSGNDLAVDCQVLLANIESARESFEQENNSMTCSIFRNALSQYISNCSEGALQLQQELDMVSEICRGEDS